jgi:hypothetical protein
MLDLGDAFLIRLTVLTGSRNSEPQRSITGSGATSAAGFSQKIGNKCLTFTQAISPVIPGKRVFCKDRSCILRKPLKTRFLSDVCDEMNTRALRGYQAPALIAMSRISALYYPHRELHGGSRTKRFEVVSLADYMSRTQALCSPEATSGWRQSAISTRR